MRVLVARTLNKNILHSQPISTTQQWRNHKKILSCMSNGSVSGGVVSKIESILVVQKVISSSSTNLGLKILHNTNPVFTFNQSYYNNPTLLSIEKQSQLNTRHVSSNSVLNINKKIKMVSNFFPSRYSFYQKFKHRKTEEVIKLSAIQSPFFNQSAKLNEQERSEQLTPLLNSGWTMVNGRDAIYKEYVFKNFNEVFCAHFSF